MNEWWPRLTMSVVLKRSESAQEFFKESSLHPHVGWDRTMIHADVIKCGYPPVELERKLFAFLVGSNREQGQPDQRVALIRAINAEKNESSMWDRKKFLESMMDILLQGIAAQLERVPDFALGRDVTTSQPDMELTTLILKFVLPDVKAPAVEKVPAAKKAPAAKKEPGEPAATGMRSAVQAQPVVEEEPGKAATTSKRAPDVKAPAVEKAPAAKEEPGEPAATGKRSAVQAQPVVEEEPGKAATTSKRARCGK
jgi:hypothetical protein